MKVLSLESLLIGVLPLLVARGASAQGACSQQFSNGTDLPEVDLWANALDCAMRVGDRNSAIEYARKAADAARRSGSPRFTSFIEQISNLEHQVGGLPGPAGAQRTLEALLTLAEQSALAGKYREALEAGREAMQIAGRTDQGQVAVTRSRLHALVYRVGEAAVATPPEQRAVARQAADCAIELATLLGGDNINYAEALKSRLRSVLLPTFTIEGNAHGRLLAFVGSGSTLVPDTVYGARNELNYRVHPIIVGGARAAVRFLDDAGWNIFGLKAGYETDRVFSGSGTISTSNALAQQLGVSGAAADIFNGALAVAGVSVEVELATFTNGRAELHDVASDTIVSTAPLQFTRRRIEGTANVSRYLWPDKRPGTEDSKNAILAHALYYDLTLPRIAYLVNDDRAQNSVVTVESQPQKIDVTIGGLGASYRWVMADTKDVHVTSTYTLIVGGGSVGFFMPQNLDPALRDDPTNRTRLRETTIAIVTRLGATADFRVVGDQCRLYLGATLFGEQYYANAPVSGSGSGTVGFADAFVGGTLHATLRYDP